MERALDPALLRLALSTPGGLPPPEQLGALMADIEVRLFMRQPTLPDELLASAWYLHGIASAEAAPHHYPLERRRAAWQVSAHAFDLALESEQDSMHERLRYGFAAQIGYMRAGLQPNAMAMHRKLEPLLDAPNVELDPEVASLQLGVTFLRLDWGRLRTTLSVLQSELDGLARRSGVTSLAGTPFGALSDLTRGCRVLMRYLREGDTGLLEQADLALATSVQASGAERYLDSRWVAAHLRSLGGELGNTSVWAVLPPEVPAGVKRAFTMGQPAVTALWPPQVDLLSAGVGPSALHPSVRRIVLSVPTSSGKTLISQMFALSHLSAGRGDVCYIVPTRSLAREVRRDLRRRLRLIAHDVAPERTEWTEVSSAQFGSVEVHTPEGLAHMLRNDTAGMLERFGMFIFDEAHTVGEGERGFTVETCIALLHWLTRDSDHRLMLMSAAMGNSGEIRSWVDPEGAGREASSTWRGPRRLHGIYHTDIDWNAPAEQRPVASKQWPVRHAHPLYGVVRLRPTSTGMPVRLRTPSPVGHFVVRHDAQGRPERNPATGKRRRHQSSTPVYRSVVDVVRLVAETGPVLIVRPTRQATRKMADVLAEDLPEDPATARLATFAAARLGDEHPLARALRRGVAYHHAGLPTDILDGIEDAVRDGNLRYVTATTSLTDGVNLPVRTVIIDEPAAGEHVRPLSPAQVLNAVGRAGRACVESEGWAILVRYGPPSHADFDRLDPTVAELQVRSALTDDDALAALAEFEELQRTTADAVYDLADSLAADFASYFWLILTAEEELYGLGSPVDIAAALPATLAWQQLDEETKQRWLALATAVQSSYRAADPARRRRWGRIATSIGTARALDDLTDRLVEAAIDQSADLTEPWTCVALLDRTGVLSVLESLPEVTTPAIYTRRSGPNRTAVVLDGPPILRRWLQGADITELANEFLAEVEPAEYRYEQLADYLTVRFEQQMSWLVGAVIEWVNRRLVDAGREDHMLCPEIGGYIRYGTADPLALALLRRTVRTRRLANVVAAAGRARGHETIDSLVDWLRHLGPGGWVAYFSLSPGELHDLLEVARDTDFYLLANLLRGETVTVPLPQVEAPSSGPSVIQTADDVAPGALAVHVGGRRIAEVPTRYHTDAVALLETGLPYQAEVIETAEGWNLTLQLAGD